jgi:(p)ppGpp synthase/HD superfamily hydrolase
MRTALRLIRDYDVRDADIIAAMLLHDSVEDHADQLASFAPVETVPAQADTTQKALAALGLSFSVTVSELVHNVTNSPHTTAVSQEQKNAAYAEGVAIKIAKSPETFLMKLSDFTDNAVGIMWSEQTSKVKKLATKYLPVFEVFLQQLSVYEDSASLTPKQITTARQQLLIGKQRCSLLAA